jgi:hypothetical protein
VGPDQEGRLEKILNERKIKENGHARLVNLGDNPGHFIDHQGR